jgi:hypothetical protein
LFLGWCVGLLAFQRRYIKRNVKETLNPPKKHASREGFPDQANLKKKRKKKEKEKIKKKKRKKGEGAHLPSR